MHHERFLEAFRFENGFVNELGVIKMQKTSMDKDFFGNLDFTLFDHAFLILLE